MRNREPQWKRVAAYIDKHGSISWRPAAHVLEISDLSNRVKDAEKALGIVYDRERVDYVNGWGEPRHYTLYKRPEAA